MNSSAFPEKRYHPIKDVLGIKAVELGRLVDESGETAMKWWGKSQCQTGSITDYDPAIGPEGPSIRKSVMGEMEEALFSEDA